MSNPAEDLSPLDALYETDVQTPYGKLASAQYGDGGATRREAERDTELEEPHRATGQYKAPGLLGADFEAIVSSAAFA